MNDSDTDTELSAMLNRVFCMDALELLRRLPDQSINCVVTSPPYFGLRNYGVAGQIGLEPTPAEYVCKLVTLFRELRRVLRDDGTIWLNLGDSYANDGKWGGATGGKHVNGLHGESGVGRSRKATGLPPKSLMLIPARVAIALQDDGWIIRSEIIWSKTAPMPESVTDRPTKAHEAIFLITKEPHYYYDADAIAEPARDWGTRDRSNGKYHNEGTGLHPHTGLSGKPKMGGGNFSRRYSEAQLAHGGISERRPYLTRNKRSVWTVGPEPFSGAHFATFPRKLITPMILAGCPVGGVVLDPFMGSGTTALVARDLGRQYIGSELNPEYVAIAERRLSQPFTLPMLFEETEAAP